MLARHTILNNRISLLPIMPDRNRIAPVFNWLLAGFDSDSGRTFAAFGLGSNEVRGRFWSHKRRRVPVGT